MRCSRPIGSDLIVSELVVSVALAGGDVVPDAGWLQAGLAKSTAPWKIVYMHFSPYSSGTEHGSLSYAQWPYQAWGASAVIGSGDVIQVPARRAYAPLREANGDDA